MSKSKLKLDITCLSSRQRRRIFFKKFYNISHMTVNSNSGLKVQNELVNRLDEPNDIEQLPQQQNVLREINYDHSNVINTDDFNYVSHSAINSLLKILVKYGHNIPIDARTVLQTPKRVEIIKMVPGKYYHAGLVEGLKKSIRKHYCRITCPLKILINVGIDGLPLTKSSGSQFWPILASIVADFYTKPFIVGVYHGFQKPQCCNSFLKYFRDDCLEIFQNGITEYDKQITVKVNVFICDAPAKSFVKGIKGHNAYFGCGNCIQEGDYVENRVTFPEINATLILQILFYRFLIMAKDFAVVTFLNDGNNEEETVSEVPSLWLCSNLTKCWWPSVKNINIFIVKKIPPVTDNPRWSVYPIKFHGYYVKRKQKGQCKNSQKNTTPYESESDSDTTSIIPNPPDFTNVTIDLPNQSELSNKNILIHKSSNIIDSFTENLNMDYISRIGGRSAKENLIRIHRTLFSNEVAKQPSWKGLRDHFKISSLNSIIMGIQGKIYVYI
ncbi:hypothetical protein ALC62_06346 [Cyphomyrmex costatus]|uniref:DUF4806 domain-containing protein n=1 Tax=Cyphomyrmex costatus TaxID=456900 RepID=A0A151IIZ5_9HYME|nr:hypothetical protein ALC62_06346 [Cyphomyrmex costatus]